MSIICPPEPCPFTLKSCCVFYTGTNLVYTGINTNDNLQVALQKIDNSVKDIPKIISDINWLHDNIIGGSDAFFSYKQVFPSSIWEITHTLNKFPSVTITDTSGDEVLGNVRFVDNANIIITFSAPFAGTAYLN